MGKNEKKRGKLERGKKSNNLKKVREKVRETRKKGGKPRVQHYQ
jgi:hypothetical protein